MLNHYCKSQVKTGLLNSVKLIGKDVFPSFPPHTKSFEISDCLEVLNNLVCVYVCACVNEGTRSHARVCVCVVSRFLKRCENSTRKSALGLLLSHPIPESYNRKR